MSTGACIHTSDNNSFPSISHTPQHNFTHQVIFLVQMHHLLKSRHGLFGFGSRRAMQRHAQLQHRTQQLPTVFDLPEPACSRRTKTLICWNVSKCKCIDTTTATSTLICPLKRLQIIHFSYYRKHYYILLIADYPEISSSCSNKNKEEHGKIVDEDIQHMYIGHHEKLIGRKS